MQVDIASNSSAALAKPTRRYRGQGARLYASVKWGCPDAARRHQDEHRRRLHGKNGAFREAIAGDGDHPTVDEVTDVVTLDVDVLKTHWFKHALIPNTACRRGCEGYRQC